MISARGQRGGVWICRRIKVLGDNIFLRRSCSGYLVSIAAFMQAGFIASLSFSPVHPSDRAASPFFIELALVASVNVADFRQSVSRRWQINWLPFQPPSLHAYT